LREAGEYVTALPAKEHDKPHLARALSQNLMGRRCLRGLAVPRALNRHDERVFDTSRKAHHCGKRKLARDRTTP
jgi:hypothetical protein